MKKICEYCGKEFESTTGKAKYCSRYCANKVYCATDKYKKIKANRRKSEDYRCKDMFRGMLKSAMLGHKCVSPHWKDLPYTYLELREYIASLFTDDMTWENYGKVWHLDHIKPLACYTFRSEDGVEDKVAIAEANSFKNLRPLHVKDNLHKSSFYNGKRYKSSYKGL